MDIIYCKKICKKRHTFQRQDKHFPDYGDSGKELDNYWEKSWDCDDDFLLKYGFYKQYFFSE